MSAYGRTLVIDEETVLFLLKKGPPGVPLPPDYDAAEPPVWSLRAETAAGEHVLEKPARSRSLEDYGEEELVRLWRDRGPTRKGRGG